jgi:hypothetical protein
MDSLNGDGQSYAHWVRVGRELQEPACRPAVLMTVVHLDSASWRAVMRCQTNFRRSASSASTAYVFSVTCALTLAACGGGGGYGGGGGNQMNMQMAPGFTDTALVTNKAEVVATTTTIDANAKGPKRVRLSQLIVDFDSMGGSVSPPPRSKLALGIAGWLANSQRFKGASFVTGTCAVLIPRRDLCIPWASDARCLCGS